MQKIRLATGVLDWDLALQLLIESLIRKGCSLAQVDQLLLLRQQLRAYQGGFSGGERQRWVQQVEGWVQSMLHTSSGRQDSFWK